MIVVPSLLVKNEEVWIGRILASLANVYPHIIVCETGSTDSTVSEIEKVPNVTILSFAELSENYQAYCRKNLGTMWDWKPSPQFLTWCRQFMQDEAKRKFGATHIHLCDGDELYPTKYLRFIADNPMPEHARSGFTSGIECGELENGELWFYNAGLNRQAIIPVDSRWKGEYPFESPDCYIPGDPTNHYFPIPDGLRGFYHLHHTRRSTREADVYLRVSKRDQFSMRDAPDLYPETFWLKSEKYYIDE